MKRVVSPEMVAHLWADQSQSEARNQQGNIYFRDSTIYSYGGHFPMARHVVGKNKKPIVLLTTRRYSVTTARHLSMVRQAAQHLEVIECEQVEATMPSSHQKNLEAMRKQCEALLLKAARARVSVDYYVRDAEQLVVNHLRYRQAFGLRLDKPLVIPEDWQADTLARVKRLREQEKKRDARLIQDTSEVLNYWKQGQAALLAAYAEKERPKTAPSKVPVALRLSADGQEIETSLGARVPATHAKRIWQLIQQIVSKQLAPYQHNGHTEHVGSFRVDSIDEQGTLKAGCHTIRYEAMAELASRLGW